MLQKLSYFVYPSFKPVKECVFAQETDGVIDTPIIFEEYLLGLYSSAYFTNISSSSSSYNSSS